MKFHQLPIGQRFSWQGERYEKSSPLLATHLDSGKPRMILRSAEIAAETPQDVPAPTAVQPRELPFSQVEQLLATYEERLLAHLATLDPPLPQLEAVRRFASGERERLLHARTSDDG